MYEISSIFIQSARLWELSTQNMTRNSFWHLLQDWWDVFFTFVWVWGMVLNWFKIHGKWYIFGGECYIFQWQRLHFLLWDSSWLLSHMTKNSPAAKKYNLRHWKTFSLYELEDSRLKLKHCSWISSRISDRIRSLDTLTISSHIVSVTLYRTTSGQDESSAVSQFPLQLFVTIMVAKWNCIFAFPVSFWQTMCSHQASALKLGRVTSIYTTTFHTDRQPQRLSIDTSIDAWNGHSQASTILSIAPIWHTNP